MRALRPRRELLLLGAVVAVALGAFLALVALDVARWRDAVEDDDIRYLVSPTDAGLWRPDTLAPFAAGERVLALGDDLAFRRMLRTLALSRLDDATVSGSPEAALRRTAVAEQLEAIAVRDPDPALRSRALNFLGVMSIMVWSSGGGGGSVDRGELLAHALASFERAIALDPDNAEAKVNLQLLLSRGEGVLPTEASAGRDPRPGGRGARGAGAGEPGSGY